MSAFLENRTQIMRDRLKVGGLGLLVVSLCIRVGFTPTKSCNCHESWRNRVSYLLCTRKQSTTGTQTQHNLGRGYSHKRLPDRDRVRSETVTSPGCPSSDFSLVASTVKRFENLCESCLSRNVSQGRFEEVSVEGHSSCKV